VEQPLGEDVLVALDRAVVTGRVPRADHLLSRRSRSIRSTTSGGGRVGEEFGTLERSRSPASPYWS
jgi:hypothetical protein